MRPGPKQGCRAISSSNSISVCDELERKWNEAILTYCTILGLNFPGGTEGILETRSRYSRYSDGYSNLESNEDKKEALPLDPTLSVISSNEETVNTSKRTLYIMTQASRIRMLPVPVQDMFSSLNERQVDKLMQFLISTKTKRNIIL
jgi:hypothetical protein